MPLPTFPVEIIDEFIYYLAVSPGEPASQLQDLQACSLASYTWRKRALPFLFRSLRVTFSLDAQSPTSLTAFLAFLTSPAGIAFYVKELILKADTRTQQSFCDSRPLRDILLLLPRLQSLCLSDVVLNPYETLAPARLLSVDSLKLESSNPSKSYSPYGEDDLQSLLSLFGSINHLFVKGYQLSSYSSGQRPSRLKLSSMRLEDVKGCSLALQLLSPQELSSLSSLTLGTLGRYDVSLVARYLRENPSKITFLALEIDEVIYESHYTHRNDLHKLALSSCAKLGHLTLAFSNFVLDDSVTRREVVTNAANAWSCVEDILGTLVHPTQRAPVHRITFKLDIETPLHLMLDRHAYSVLERVEEVLLSIPTLTDVVLVPGSFSQNETFSRDEALSFFQAMFPNIRSRIRYSVIL